jgi:hypothetical protein
MNSLDDESDPAGVRFPHDSIHDESFNIYHSCISEFFTFLTGFMEIHRADENHYYRFLAAMPSAIEDDWSDSDEEIGSEVETAVLLGVPDGAMETDADIKDAAVSRIGGRPVRACLFDHVRSMCQCSLLDFFSRHYCLRENHRSLPHSARIARAPWNYLCRSGVRLRIALWTERCTSGDVPRVHVNGRTEGRSVLFR